MAVIILSLTLMFSICCSLNSNAQTPSESTELRSLKARVDSIDEDLNLILKKANLVNYISFSLSQSPADTVRVECSNKIISLKVFANDNWGQVFYYGLFKLGFLFPHPRMQISPSAAQILKHCGKTYSWRPAIKYHGFHFHTQHPSEWVHGFLEGQTQIGIDTVRWLARNQQNIFDVYLLDENEQKIFKNLKEPFKLARLLGIHAGITVGMVFHQQNAYKLIPVWRSFFEQTSVSELKKRLNYLLDNIDISFINLEAGTSEFTPTRYELSLKWMNIAAQIAANKNIALLVKIHNSSNQKSKIYGNFNFLPQYADPTVGILPHTVFLYSLEEPLAPMYRNDNFHYMRDFMLNQKDKRRTWFYPETSYFCGLDIDAPLFFTDYLLTRSADTKFLYQNKIEGQLNFTTGQELGYWLFDWTYTLLNHLENEFDPYIGLKLLKQNIASWKIIVDFQNTYFVKKGLVSIITFSTLGDELLPGLHQTLKRNLPIDLKNDPHKLQTEILALNEAIINEPKNIKLDINELDIMWNITRLRMHHALNVRLALKHSDKKYFYLNKAVQIRNDVQNLVINLIENYNRYPEAKIFERHNNPTAYKWGYGYLASNLYYWHREEEIVRQNNYKFYFMPIFTLREVISGWVL